MTNTTIIITCAITLATWKVSSFIYRSFRKVFVIWENQVGLHFIDGKLVELLEAGRHSFWGKKHSLEIMDKRIKPIVIQSQDIPTADGITVKSTVVGLFQKTDPMKAYRATSDSEATLHTIIQLALREIVTGYETEDLLEKRSTLGSALLEKVHEGASDLGITVTELAIRDIILPGEIKRAITATMQSKQEAKAQLEVARGSAAALRVMANSTKQYENNPTLLKLRYIETLEKAASTMGNTFIIGQKEITENI